MEKDDGNGNGNANGNDMTLDILTQGNQKLTSITGILLLRVVVPRARRLNCIDIGNDIKSISRACTLRSLSIAYSNLPALPLETPVRLSVPSMASTGALLGYDAVRGFFRVQDHQPAPPSQGLGIYWIVKVG